MMIAASNGLEAGCYWENPSIPNEIDNVTSYLV